MLSNKFDLISELLDVSLNEGSSSWGLGLLALGLSEPMNGRRAFNFNAISSGTVSPVSFDFCFSFFTSCFLSSIFFSLLLSKF